MPFLFSARFSFSTSEVPGSPPSTNLARQAFGQRCHARIASATRVDFFFGGVDALVLVWDLENKNALRKIVGAHVSGGINALAFVSNELLATAGADACIKTWAV